MKTVVTISGIRPDFIRMSEIFRKLDENFNHILIHTGQHYDKMLSGVFFDELKIRKPDYNLRIGGDNAEHFEQQSVLTTAIIDLLRGEKIKPDIILFLGDSNSVLAAVPLKKEGYKIGHIEAGMRSYDRRMLEEINRVVCDHCSDLLFVYHEDYKKQALKEGIPEENIYVVGNTIVEPCLKILKDFSYLCKKNDLILVDIHRPENFKSKIRLQNIIAFVDKCRKKFGVEVKMLEFKRTFDYIKQFKLEKDLIEAKIQVIPLMSYKEFLRLQYDSLFVISDSGTAQEEAALLGTPVIVPRDFTERPQSVDNNCSYMLDVENTNFQDFTFDWFDYVFCTKVGKIEWLGNGTTSANIIKILHEKL